VGFALKPELEALTFPIRHLRQPMTLNLFKRQLLGDRHIPTQSQTEEVLSALSEFGMDETFDPRTWRGWFGEKARRARGDSLGSLDVVAMKLPFGGLQSGMLKVKPATLFFLKMLEGGLCKELLEPNGSKNPKYPLLQKADEYQPVSAWHLHLDAIEAVALAEANGNADWETVKAIAASKVLCTLHERWNPRDGSIYSTLSSNLQLEWERASNEEKEHMRKGCSQMFPDIFPYLMKKAAAPDWSQMNLDVDIGPSQVHKLLFAMSADEDFMVEDRFDAWALDLATAALAMLARALTDRHNTLGAVVGPELIFWDAYEMLFFREEERQEAVFDALYRAMECSGARCSRGSFDLLISAGTKYKNALFQMGLSSEKILELTSRCWALHPLIYR
jgi:hypothetical protein